jgi:hypothetical protein
MSKPYKSITASTAPLKRMEAALEMYEKWVKENKYDRAFKRHSRGVQDEIQRRIELQAGKKNLKYPCYQTRLLFNKKRLEDDLSILMSAFVEDSHVASHRKLNEADDKIQIEKMRTNGKMLDYARLQDMSSPKTVLLQYTLERFGLFMSDTKRKYIKCVLGKRCAKKPEDFEDLVRKQTADKSKLPRRHVTRKTNNDKLIYEQMLKSLKGNILDMLTKDTVKSPVSKAFKELQSSIYDSILAISDGEPQSAECKSLYLKIAGALSNLIMKAEIK